MSESVRLAPGDLDGEGFPYDSTDPDPSLPPEPPAELSAAETAASLTPVDMTLWTPESYPPVAGFPSASWYRWWWWAHEYFNAQPTLCYSDFPALWTALEGNIGIWTSSDNDYVGFAVGFEPGDTSNPSADYLVVDWKRGTQWFDFGEPSCTPGSTAYRGLAVSRVFGVPTADELWGHTNFDALCSDLSNGLEELGRANTLGDTGWWRYTPIHFRLEYTPTELKVYVNGQLEIELLGDFAQGRWACYNFSQENTSYFHFERESLPVPAAIDIKPGSYPNAINVNGHGVIPVAILGSTDFDVTWVDVNSLSFAGLQVNVRGKGVPQCSIEDVSGPDGVPDGYADLVCQFADDASLWVPGDGVATLSGSLLPEYGGVPFDASDEITVVP